MSQYSIIMLKKAVYNWMGVNFNPNAEAENQRLGLANSPSDNSLPLQYSQGVTGSLHLR